MTEPLDPAAIMAEHETHRDNDGYCFPQIGKPARRCLPYRLAAENARLVEMYERDQHFIGALQSDLAALREQIQRVRGLHAANYINDEVTPDPICGGCARFVVHPDCPTLAVLKGAQTKPVCGGYLGGGVLCEKPQGHDGQCWDPDQPKP
jgi:hypothetical protein